MALVAFYDKAKLSPAALKLQDDVLEQVRTAVQRQHKTQRGRKSSRTARSRKRGHILFAGRPNP